MKKDNDLVLNESGSEKNKTDKINKILNTFDPRDRLLLIHDNVNLISERVLYRMLFNNKYHISSSIISNWNDIPDLHEFIMTNTPRIRDEEIKLFKLLLTMPFLRQHYRFIFLRLPYHENDNSKKNK